jgi:hypothetical protein
MEAGRKLPTDLINREEFELPRSFDDLTPQFLTRALQRSAPGIEVHSVAISDVTEGTGSRARLTLEYNAVGIAWGLPKTMWLKSWFNALRYIQVESDGMIGEIAFYRFAPQLPIRAARSYYAGIDPTGQGMVLLEDLVSKQASFFSASTPLNLIQVRDGLDQLARLHGAYWDLPRPSENVRWPAPPNAGLLGKIIREQSIPALPTLLRQPHLQGRLSAELLAEGRFARAMAKLLDMASSSPLSLMHFDPHLGNLSMNKDGGVFFVDWQFFRVGHWSHDVSYFISGSITTENRREWERGLLEHYLEKLQEHGGRPPSFDSAWHSYAAGQLHGVFSWINALLDMQSLETIHTFLARHVNAVKDLGTLDLLD